MSRPLEPPGGWRRALRRCAGALLLLGCRPGPAHQVPAAWQRIQARALAHVGDSRVLTGIVVVHSIARVSGPRRQWETEIVSSRDGRVRFAQSDGYTAGVDGDRRWQLDSAGRPVAPLDSASESGVRGHELHMLVLDPSTRWHPIGQVGDTVFRGQRAVVAHFTDLLGAQALSFFSAADTTPLGFRIMNHSGQGPEVVEVELLDWKDYGPVRFFSRAIFWQDTLRFEHRYRLLEFPVASAGLFAPPDSSR